MKEKGFPKLLVKSLLNGQEYYYKFEDEMFSFGFPGLP